MAAHEQPPKQGPGSWQPRRPPQRKQRPSARRRPGSNSLFRADAHAAAVGREVHGPGTVPVAVLSTRVVRGVTGRAGEAWGRGVGVMGRGARAWGSRRCMSRQLHRTTNSAMVVGSMEMVTKPFLSQYDSPRFSATSLAASSHCTSAAYLWNSAKYILEEPLDTLLHAYGCNLGFGLRHPGPVGVAKGSVMIKDGDKGGEIIKIHSVI